MTDRRSFPLDPRYSVSADGRVFRDVDTGRGKPRELTRYDSKRGYLRVLFEGKFHNVHQMVALTFIPNPEGKPEVAHNNGIKHDNRVENLRWATRKENSDDIDLHGNRLLGETHPGSVLTIDDVRKIQRLVVGKPPRCHPYHREVAEMFGVSRECVTRIANDQRWSRATASC